MAITIRIAAAVALAVALCGCPPAEPNGGEDNDEFHGLYRGQIVDNADPLARGRLRVVVPDVLGPSEVWAPRNLSAGERAQAAEGGVATPPVGAEVYVAFEAGDPAHPVCVGFLWPDEEGGDAS